LAENEANEAMLKDDPTWNGPGGDGLQPRRSSGTGGTSRGADAELHKTLSC